ncbi:hypothetical protein FOZ63_019038 [Perkinsus olseni]|uniref:Uncharacterized protein n=2 Tax=Perkinsus olseni TaxID=32597 RepID=A0A7J6UKC7_PEROL|nr:hypothetical protein FOZ63_019038 [Perkinsus olseni]
MKILSSLWPSRDPVSSSSSSIEHYPYTGVNPIEQHLPQVSSLSVMGKDQPVNLRIIVAGEPGSGRQSLCRALCTAEGEPSTSYLGTATEGSSVVPTVEVGRQVLAFPDGLTREVSIEFWIITCPSEVSLDLLTAPESSPDGMILVFDTIRSATRSVLTGWLFDFVFPEKDSDQALPTPCRDRSLSTFEGNTDVREDVLTGVCPLMVVANNKDARNSWQWRGGEAPLPRPPTYVDRFVVGESCPRWTCGVNGNDAAAKDAMYTVRNRLLRYDDPRARSIFSTASVDGTVQHIDRCSWIDFLRKSVVYHDRKLFGGV